MRIHCTGELHPAGGPGSFLLCRAENAVEQLASPYAGKIQLIYLDPPFGTGDTFHVRVGSGARALKLPAFEDTLSQEDYLDWMRTVLAGCYKLLAPTGSIYVHIDQRMNAGVRMLLDEQFGAANFMNEIIWCYQSGGRSTRYYPRKHDNILFYRKSRKVFFNIKAVGVPRGPERRNHMKRFVSDDGRIAYSIKSGGKTYTYYEDTLTYPSDVWNDIGHLQQKDPERTGYATQKPEALLRRILLASSREGDTVLDLFSGSGTTAAVATKLNRRFLVADASPFALYTLRQRQLKLTGSPSMLSAPQPLLLSYPDEGPDATLQYGFSQVRGRRLLTVTKAQFDGSRPLVYAALGRMDGATFLPVLTDCRPRMPLKFQLGDVETSVLHLVDALGRQGFFSLEPS